MARTRYTAEEIISHLRMIEIETGKGNAAPVLRCILSGNTIRTRNTKQLVLKLC